jgi:hypothetical protein
LIFLFPKCPYHIFKKRKNQKKKEEKEEEKTKKIYKYMLGWSNHPIVGGWPPRLAWGGLATPSGPRGGSAAPWAKCSKMKI